MQHAHPLQCRAFSVRFLILAGVASPWFVPTSAIAVPAYALTSTNQLLQFDTSSPTTIVGSPLTITGLSTGEDLLGIDFRQSDFSQLFALGNLGQVYRVNFTTGAATPVGSPLDPTAVPLNGSTYGFDFNPAVDRVRVVSDLGENFRVNPNDGSLAGGDAALAFAAADPNASALPTITASAYTNNDTNPATGTALYGIDSALGVLVTQDPPNMGTLNTVGSLGLGADVPLFAGFDIINTNNAAFALTSFEPPFGSLPALNARLFSINLSTGAATSLGLLGDGTGVITGLAVVPEPATVLLAMGASLLVARRRTLR